MNLIPALKEEIRKGIKGQAVGFRVSIVATQ